MQPTIVIYTGKICSHCHDVKEYLTEMGYEFEERSISNPAHKKAIISMGYRAIPLLLINGLVYLGSDLKKIQELINENTK